MKKYKRIFTIVLDSLGIGEMADSKDYGDVGVNTLGHILCFVILDFLTLHCLRKRCLARLASPYKYNLFHRFKSL